MNFHPTQSLVARDNTQFRIVDCGRQWGKTTLAIWEMFGCAYSKSGRNVRYYATTFDQARDIVWNQLKDITRQILAKEPNESRLEIVIKTKDGGESMISLEGWESVERARGQQFDMLVLDEVTKMRNFKSGWEGALMATLLFRRGSALFMSTPNGFDHFHQLYLKGQEGDKLWKSWKFTSLDNPHIPIDYLQGIKNSVTPDYWAQEYLAEFIRFTGLIYKDFDMNEHVGYFDFTKGETGDYMMAIDFAVRGWTASLVSVIKPDGHLYILDEYKKESETAQNHSEAIKNMVKQYVDLDKLVGYADPAGFAKNQQKGDLIWAIADEYLEAGLPIVPANNEVVGGINYVAQLLQQKKIHIHPRCTQLVSEIMQYQWKDQLAKQTETTTAPEKVRKINDHLVDCLRYICYSKPSAPREEESSKIQFPIEFKLKIDPPNEDDDQFTPLTFSSNPFE